jgi:hypothetical protein
LFDKSLLFDVKSIRNGKVSVKDKNRAESEGSKEPAEENMSILG